MWANIGKLVVTVEWKQKKKNIITEIAFPCLGILEMLFEKPDNLMSRDWNVLWDVELQSTKEVENVEETVSTLHVFVQIHIH